jgi:hypothetical protein
MNTVVPDVKKNIFVKRNILSVQTLAASPRSSRRLEPEILDRAASARSPLWHFATDHEL